MKQELSIQDNLDNLQQILTTLASEISPLFGDDSVQVSAWQRSLAAATESLREQILRIAVVGSVKSGKSTFINALLGRDLLKRGAGIVTAFITRIRSGPEERGWIEIKSWQEINAEINEALSLLELPQTFEGSRYRDIRQPADRGSMEQLLQQSRLYHAVTYDGFDPNVVLINSYLKGYEALAPYVRNEPSRLEFAAGEIHRHQDFVGQESQAVYLKDMEMQVPLSWLGRLAEIGDCQGSDSPNPRHFALLQEYLLSSHCILYLISSRVGLRQGDLKLIEAIRILRLLPHTLFILNVDLDEHGDLNNLRQTQDKVEQELRLLVGDARVYSLSALLQLLEAIGTEDNLTPRERYRLKGWREDGEMLESCRRGYARFNNDLHELVERERTRVLYGGVLSHFQRVGQSMKDAVTTRQGLLSKDREELTALADEIRKRQQSISAALNTVEHTLHGLSVSLKQRVHSAADSYFDTKYGPIIRDTMHMIEQHPVEEFDQNTVEQTRKWLTNLYVFYQDFRKMLAGHIIDKVNLRIFDFGKKEEEQVEIKLLETAAGYWDLLGQALTQYRQTLIEAGMDLSLEIPETLPHPPRPTIGPPTFSAFIERSDSLARGDLLFRFGLRRLRHLFSGVKDKVLRRGAEVDKSGEEFFREAVELVKRETQKELLASFKDYRQNFKFMYLFRFIEQYTQEVVQIFRSFGEATLVDIGHLEETARQRDMSQQNATEDLAIVQHRLKHACEQLQNLSRSLGLS
jgi:GTPase SAR1 family protein